MMQHNDTHKSDYTVIVGCGRVGAGIAGALSEENRSVLVLDKSRASFRKLPPSFSGLTLEGEGTDLEKLRAAELDRATTLICATNDDNANIMIALLAKKIFHVKKVIARLYDPERECTYHEFDVDTICPALLSVKTIENMLKDGERL